MDEWLNCPECGGDGWLIYWAGDKGPGDPSGRDIKADCDVCFGEGKVENPEWENEDAAKIHYQNGMHKDSTG